MCISQRSRIIKNICIFFGKCIFLFDLAKGGQVTRWVVDPETILSMVLEETLRSIESIAAVIMKTFCSPFMKK